MNLGPVFGQLLAGLQNADENGYSRQERRVLFSFLFLFFVIFVSQCELKRTGEK